MLRDSFFQLTTKNNPHKIVAVKLGSDFISFWRVF